MKICSIVTVTYKDPLGLLRTYESIRALRKDQRLEWVVVDSSPELNREIIDRAKQEQFPLLYITSKPDGIYEAMNLGIQSAQGDFLWFLNGGDELYESEPFLRMLENCQGYDLAIGSIEFVDEKNNTKKIIRSPKSLFFRLLGINRICHQSVIYAKKLFTGQENLYNTKYRIVADYIHLLKARRSLQNTYIEQAIIAKFHKGGISQKIFPALKEFFLVHWNNEARVPFVERPGHYFFWALLSISIVGKKGLKRFLGLLGINI